ncbi:hypothetical protein [Sulfurimonas autotrophica]|uniref:Transformation system protein n=1 Tax=Sulfurimonas autotrophica (strain ATCC BAA-671 / DSM 16294 / JCM 11897 / OK10) TaxID=563040 RepID=E0UUY7_SULAO|nr:hypothetical protein [Sulfurimonas autotrophica]ADN08499.1 hypothetical protein Saut_0450 [Sulfurimonas autotrophica DSM 16294]
MKKFIAFLFILSSIAGAKSLNIIHYDPFKKAKILLNTHSAKKLFSTPKRILSINAILNKKVYINGRFYRVGEVVYGYKIINIADNYIQVKKKGKISIIPLIKSNNLDIIKLKDQG